MWPFEKKKTTEIVPVTTEPISQKKLELATVQVPDIKQYLVDEYERAAKLEEKIQEMESLLNACKETQLKYDATLVTLDELKTRVGRRDKEIEKLKQQLYKKEDELRVAYDELNTFKIKISRAAIDKDEIKNEIVNEIKDKIVKRFHQHKGALSKKRAIELVMNDEVRDE